MEESYPLTTKLSGLDPTMTEPTVCDFAFVMKPVKVLKNAFKALFNPNFNPRQSAVIQPGYERIVSNMTEPPEVDPTMTEPPLYDFAFVMKPVKVLKNAFEALSNPYLNPRERAVIQVGQPGCEIIVSTDNDDTGSKGFGYLGLKATGLEEFQCNTPIQKSFSLKRIPSILRSSGKVKNDSVFLYSLRGSNELSFQWDSDDLGLCTSTIGLKDVYPENDEIEEFPKRIPYCFEAVIQSSILRDISVTLHKKPMPRPETVGVILQPEDIMIISGNVFICSMEIQGQGHKISTEWRYWESLESASLTADKALIYLVKDPITRIMVRFHLEQLGDLVYLNPAIFKSVPKLSFLGHFRRLIQPSQNSKRQFGRYRKHTK